jgi:patatin-like phospholipase/acyl hydrolase
MVARALAILEDHLGQPAGSLFHLAAGTSTGALIAACLAAGLTARQLFDLYCKLGGAIFPKSWRARLWPLTRYKYPLKPLETALYREIGDKRIGDLWLSEPPMDVVLTTFDLLENRTRFIKPWKEEYREWPVAKAVLASCAVPTFFPAVEGRYVDGGVGAYANPCYLAAYELLFCLGWKPAETTLISLGAGKSPSHFNPKQAKRMWAWEWIEPMISAFTQSADDQQVHLVNTFFQDLDFRRFQVKLNQSIAMDDASKIPRLAVYGEELGRMILSDMTDPIQEVYPRVALQSTR